MTPRPSGRCSARWLADERAGSHPGVNAVEWAGRLLVVRQSGLLTFRAFGAI
jgi:hypothetical protein